MGRYARGQREDTLAQRKAALLWQVVETLDRSRIGTPFDNITSEAQLWTSIPIQKPSAAQSPLELQIKQLAVAIGKNTADAAQHARLVFAEWWLKRRHILTTLDEVCTGDGPPEDRPVIQEVLKQWAAYITDNFHGVELMMAQAAVLMLHKQRCGRCPRG